MGIPIAAILLLALGTVAPLTDDQKSRLDAAADGGDYREDAFAALLENVGAWTPGLGDAPVRLSTDVALLLADPAAYRGALFRLSGTIQQHSWLEPPHAAVAEWFVRNGAGRPMLVYVYGMPREHSFRPGQRVMLPGRFYKRVDDTARDGRVHQYAAFVAAFPRRVEAGAGGGAGVAAGMGRLWIVAVPVVVMLVVFVALMVHVQRGGRSGRTGHRFGAAAVLPASRAHPVPPAPPAPGTEAPLPEDPTEALAELRRRAEAPDS